MTGRAHLIAAFGVCACGLTPAFDPVVIDLASNCNAVTIDPTLEWLVNAPPSPYEILAAAYDRDKVGAWLLMRHVDTANAIHYTAVYADSRTALHELEIIVPGPPGSGDRLELVPGPETGEAYLQLATPDQFRLWHLRAAETPPLQAISGDLAQFPPAPELCDEDDDGELDACDTSAWPLDLAFIGGIPHLVSVPPQTLDSTTYVYVGQLDSNLALTRSSELRFARKCTSLDDGGGAQDAACDDINARTTYPVIDLLGFQSDPRPIDHQLFILRQVAFDGVIEPQPELVLVSLFLDEQLNTAGVLRSQPESQSPTITTSQTGLVVDPYYAYMLYTTYESGPRVMRAQAAVGTTFEPLTLALPDEVELLQLDNDVALSTLRNGFWEVLKLFPDAPEQSGSTVYVGLPDLVEVAPAGVGAFLLRSESGATDLVRIDCTNDNE